MTGPHRPRRKSPGTSLASVATPDTGPSPPDIRPSPPVSELFKTQNSAKNNLKRFKYVEFFYYFYTNKLIKIYPPLYRV
jgi:hypothetical protein